jgi:L-ascorbate metabolism protein UlaG (beta-lactamase superfamily)
MASSFDYRGVEVVFLKHAGFKIKGSKTVYIDPYDLPDYAKLDKADYILVTHDHFDHLDIEAIRKLSKSDTVIVIPSGCIVEGYKTCELDVGGVENFGEIVVRTVPAYNIDKSFHPKGKGVGYIIEMDGVRIYHAGDTDKIPEMRGLEVDIALIPVGGTYTMNLEEAKKAIEELNARYVIPMHYGALPNTQADVNKLRSDQVVVLEPMFS